MIALYYPRDNVDHNHIPIPSIAIIFGHFFHSSTQRCLTNYLNMPVGLLRGVDVGDAIAANQHINFPFQLQPYGMGLMQRNYKQCRSIKMPCMSIFSKSRILLYGKTHMCSKRNNN
jgi:hypothetical protein